MSEATLEIGYIARAHGIRGEVHIALHNPGSDAMNHVDRLFIADTEYAVLRSRPAKDSFIVALAGVADRTAAEALKGQAVRVIRDSIAEPGEVFLDDFVGRRVTTSAGAHLGQVVGVATQGQVRLIVHDSTFERMIPCVDELIVGIEDSGDIVVNLPEGWPATDLEDA